SSWHRATRPVGKCLSRTAVSTLLTFCPPAPPDRKV
ncbi:peptide chain release factor 2, partial [Nannochloropsis gaditana CCMP526]